MQLSTFDWVIVILFFLATIIIGIVTSKRAGSSTNEFFLSGRNMPWWLLGVSMVATTFSADTPNLVTDIVRKNGVSGNWAWWAFLLTGMLTVFVYAKLWRRSGVTTDLGFYEIRYGGETASFLRWFRALYLGVFFNILIMASVCLAGIKIGEVMLGLEGWQTILIVGIVTVIYSTLGGFRSVLISDFFQFFLAMIGSVWAAYVVINLPEVGGLTNLLEHQNVSPSLGLLPDFNDWEVLVPMLLIPIAVQWWSVWYPGAEPGGGGYVAQRMLAAKDEKNAIAATLFFNVAHYALRPWPWILIALASMVVFPDLASIQTQFPNIDPGIINDDLAYPAMLTYLPAGLLGLVVASLIAALMSTISTHLNWGSSYVVFDFFKRFVNPDATESEMVFVGRITTIILMILSAGLALALSNALQAFNILLQIGAGTGLLFILRWFWWRINAYSEITAMVVSFVLALGMEFLITDGMITNYEAWTNFPLSSLKLVSGVFLTTLAWVGVTLYTQPEDINTLKNFFIKIKPHASGWQPVVDQISAEDIDSYEAAIMRSRLGDETYTEDIEINKKRNLLNPKELKEYLNLNKSSLGTEILCMITGCFFVYSLLFATGFWLYGNTMPAIFASLVAVGTGFGLSRLWNGITFD